MRLDWNYCACDYLYDTLIFMAIYITTSGHTFSYISYYIPQYLLLFTPDILSVNHFGRCDFQNGYIFNLIFISISIISIIN